MLPRFARKDFYPQGWEPYLARFLELFHKYGYIYKSLDGGTWSSAKETWKLNDAEIIKAIACAHPKYFIGTRAGRTTRYAVLDIDKNSKYHTLPELQRILAALAAAGLTHSSLFRSSYSEGWHLYIFFDAPVGSATLRKYLVKLLSYKGFEITKGTLEVFPHPGAASLGMGLRLPLQPGWAWLDKATLEVDFDRAEMSATKALEYFLDALDADANSIRDFENFKDFVTRLKSPMDSSFTNNVVPIKKAHVDFAANESSIFVASVFAHMPTGIIADNWCRGRTFHVQGLFTTSQRAEALMCLGHYLFYGDPSRELPPLGYGYEEEREWALNQFFEQKHNGLSDDINRGRPDALAQVSRAANWRPQYKKTGSEVKYVPEQPLAWKLANEKRRLDARHRIEEAHSNLRKRGGSFTTIELAKAAGCSKRTLYSHADIWRQDYDNLADDFFAAGTGEYNAVDDSVSSSVVSPSSGLFVFRNSERSSRLESMLFFFAVPYERIPVLSRFIDKTMAEDSGYFDYLDSAAILKGIVDEVQAWLNSDQGAAEFYFEPIHHCFRQYEIIREHLKKADEKFGMIPSVIDNLGVSPEFHYDMIARRFLQILVRHSTTCLIFIENRLDKARETAFEKEFASAKIQLPRVAQLSQEALDELVCTIIVEFTNMVENRGSWKLFWDQEQQNHVWETEVQRLFYLFASHICETNDVDLSPETNAGAGFVDFKFSQGSAVKHLVEFKMSDNSSLIKGFTKQLKAYKHAESAAKASYVVIEVSEIEASKIELTALADADPDDRAFFVNAIPRKSASKL